MDLKLHNVDDVQVLELEGRLDAHQAPNVSQWLAEHIVPGKAKLVINLKTVTFVDSIALAVLVKAIMRCSENGGELRICNITNPVKIILELTQLYKVFNIYDTEAAAIEAFK